MGRWHCSQALRSPARQCCRGAAKEQQQPGFWGGQDKKHHSPRGWEEPLARARTGLGWVAGVHSGQPEFFPPGPRNAACIVETGGVVVAVVCFPKRGEHATVSPWLPPCRKKFVRPAGTCANSLHLAQSEIHAAAATGRQPKRSAAASVRREAATHTLAGRPGLPVHLPSSFSAVAASTYSPPPSLSMSFL